MSNIKRYDVYSRWGGSLDNEIVPAGKWVKYEDYEKEIEQQLLVSSEIIDTILSKFKNIIQNNTKEIEQEDD